jgi:molecular chaperone GrpE
MDENIKTENDKKDQIVQGEKKGEDKTQISKESESPDKEESVIKVKASEYEKLNKQVAEYKDKYIRLYAEFENARKRMEREKLEFIKYANEELITEFLGIMDNLERSIEAAKAKHEYYTAFLKGIEMVMGHIYEMLKKSGVKPIEAKGKMFDPHCHEVLIQEETEEYDDGVIVEELQKGYYLGDKIIRTTKVKVAKTKQ